MRQMRGDRQHPVVVLGRHGLDLAAGQLATCRRPRATASGSVSSIGVRMQWRVCGTGWRTRPPGRNARCRRPDARRRSGPGSGRCGTTSRMTCGLDRADVGHDRLPARGRAPWPPRPGRPRPAVSPSTTRSAPSTAVARVDRRPVGETERARFLERRLGAGAGDDLVGEPGPAQIERERAVDQPDADQRHAVEPGRLARPSHVTNSRRLSITARFSASRPTEMRRQSGRP